MTQKEAAKLDGRIVRGAATREKVLDAAERLFADIGFDGVSIRQIAQEAGVTLGMVGFHGGSKVELFAWCRRRKLPLVVVGSAGGRTDPTQVRLRDLSRTEHDALLALVRKKLRAEFNFPKNKDRYFGVPAVYSLENVRYPQADGSVCGTRPALGPDAALKLDCGAGLGAATHVTGAFAFAAVGKALELLLRERAA